MGFSLKSMTSNLKRARQKQPLHGYNYMYIYVNVYSSLIIPLHYNRPVDVQGVSTWYSIQLGGCGNWADRELD